MGRVYKFAKLRFWAETGLVKIVDELDGSYKVVDPREFLKRAEAMHDQGQRSNYIDERLFFKSLAQQMVDCAKEALSQGSPFEPGVLDFYRAHKSYGQPHSIVLDGAAEFPYPSRFQSQQPRPQSQSASADSTSDPPMGSAEGSKDSQTSR